MLRRICEWKMASVALVMMSMTDECVWVCWCVWVVCVGDNTYDQRERERKRTSERDRERARTSEKERARARESERETERETKRDREKDREREETTYADTNNTLMNRCTRTTALKFGHKYSNAVGAILRKDASWHHATSLIQPII